MGDVRGSKSRKPPVCVRGLSLDEDLGIAAELAINPEWCQGEALAVYSLPRNHFDFANRGANLFGKCRKPIVGCARLLSLLKQALQIIDGRVGLRSRLSHSCLSFSEVAQRVARSSRRSTCKLRQTSLAGAS